MSAGADIGQAVAAVIAAVRLAAPDPAEQLRIMLDLANQVGTSPVAVRCRRAAVIGAARASREYRPASYDDAVATLGTVIAAIDVEATAAGDGHAGDVFTALIKLRQSVIADLLARGASLAPIITVHTAQPMSALVQSAVLYRTAARAGEIVAAANPVHPGFLPTVLRVLAR